MNSQRITVPFMDPVIVNLGPLTITWYSLAALCAILLAWFIARKAARSLPESLKGNFRPAVMDDAAVFAAFGAILGARLGHVFFYEIDLLSHPLDIINFWNGGLRGMSFHGAFIGSVLGLIWVSRSRKLNPLTLGDIAILSTSIGFTFVRMANFINGELWGRPTDLPWGMIFLYADDQPRHPSQLYEGALEGVGLFFLLLWIARKTHFRRPGLIFGTGMVGYAFARSFTELFREPEIFTESLNYITYGMLLSLPMAIAGIILIVRALRRPAQ